MGVYCTKLVEWISTNIISNQILISSISGAGFGAWLAFHLNSQKEQQKIQEQNLNYLVYSISTIAQISSSLYESKLCFVKPREEELAAITQLVEQYYESENKDGLSIRVNGMFNHLFSTIQDCGVNFPIDIEKLSFLTKNNVNLISMLFAFEHAIGTYNVIFKELNEVLLESNQSRMTADIGYFAKVASFSTNFAKQLDSCIFFADSLNEELIKIGKKEFKKKFKVLSVGFVHERYKHLKPEPLKNWESIISKEKKHSFLKKIITKVKQVLIKS